MAIIYRQTGLLSAENWTKVYQTFREADFTAYDFETLRKSMIDYIKINYAEDYNDFIESSEFIALIDLIAFLGQSLAFRTDMNARENFMDTAERRDSILKLARMISYNPKRNNAATGYLKIDSVSTTEVVYDSDGLDLSNTKILWADSANENWLEQFTAIINAALTSGQIFGKPGNAKNIGGIRHEEYAVNANTGVVPAYRFSAGVEGQDMIFEAVSATLYGKDSVYEQAPDIDKTFNLIYKNDGSGNSSDNTGFFILFKQGELNKLDITIDEMVPNRVVDVDTFNINNSDVWLYSLNSDNTTKDQWKSVLSTSGLNIVYNNSTEKNLFQINSRINDQISLVFGDGSFANVPQGNFRIYYRVSNGLTYRISPDELRGIAISVDYVSRYNRVETLTFRASLRYTVTNASARESIEDIKQKAPQQYYTQNRMITGEDYNILPYTNYSSITKVKAVNRVSSGISRYLDLLDTSGKYSSTNVFGEDGALYYERFTGLYSFGFNTTVDLRRAIRNTIIPDIVAGKELMHYYYANVLERQPQQSSVNESSIVEGVEYTIVSIAGSDFTSYGAQVNSVGHKFIAKVSANQTRTYSVSNNFQTSWNLSGDVNGSNPIIYAKVGDTLVFNVYSPNHPFWIKSVAQTGTNFAVTVGTIISNGTNNGQITWNTTGVPPGIYYYICQNHSDMVGSIIIENFNSGTLRTRLTWNLSAIGDSSVSGYFKYNNSPSIVGNTTTNNNKYLVPGAMIKFVAPIGYYFTSTYNLLPGLPSDDDDSTVVYAAVTQVIGDGTNNGLGNFDTGLGPVVINLPMPNGSVVESVIPQLENNLPDTLVDSMVSYLESFTNFGLTYSSANQTWQIVAPTDISTSTDWLLKFEFSNVNKVYNVYHKGIRYVFHSELDTNFFYDPSLTVYDNENNTVIRDSIKILGTNKDPKTNSALGRDYVWYVDKSITRTDGYVENKSIYVTYSDTNDDSVPDIPNLFERITFGQQLPTTIIGLQADEYAQTVHNYFKFYIGRYPTQTELDYWVNLLISQTLSVADMQNNMSTSAEAISYRNGKIINDQLVFFKLVTGYDEFTSYQLLDNRQVISYYRTAGELVPQVLRNYTVGQIFYTPNTGEFYQLQLNSNGNKVLGTELNAATPLVPLYRAYIGRQKLRFQYRHNSPNSNRIDPNIGNIVDLYVLTKQYDFSYRQWIVDTSGKVIEPDAPTNTELQVSYNDLENFKSISDTIIFHSAVFKPLFGNRAEPALQAVFKVVKNQSLNISDSEIKTRVISAINDYFASENWDFGETFYFSELSAYLHKNLSPDVASIIIVPKDINISFGSFYQINSEPYEILISAATVNDVEIISAITAAQLNQNISMINRTVSL